MYAYVQALLAAGAAVDRGNIGGKTALHSAARNGHIEIVQELLAAGANVRAV